MLKRLLRTVFPASATLPTADSPARYVVLPPAPAQASADAWWLWLSAMGEGAPRARRRGGHA